MSTPYKVGDWLFCEFKLQQVTDIENGHVSGVTDGWVRGCGRFDDLCFPLDLEVKRISGAYEAWSTRLHRDGLPNLNYPDIHRWLVSHWCKTCAGRADQNFVTRQLGELEAFAKDILRRCDELRQERVAQGVKLFR